jgi:8-oxo-dGTP pyrophosphatase MutT (NUDIX family)
MSELPADDEEFVPRVAARVLLLDADGRVLLLRGIDPARPQHRYWFTVGGGCDSGESVLDAAVRETFEEVGLRLPAERFHGPLRHERTRFPFDGRWFVQEQDWYAVRMDAAQSAWQPDFSGFDEIEKATIDDVRWWSADELATTDEVYYPRDLLTVLRDAEKVV